MKGCGASWSREFDRLPLSFHAHRADLHKSTASFGAESPLFVASRFEGDSRRRIAAVSYIKLLMTLVYYSPLSLCCKCTLSLMTSA